MTFPKGGTISQNRNPPTWTCLTPLPCRPKHPGRSLPDTRHRADPWDTPGPLALQAPATSAIWYMPKELPHCSDFHQAWAQLTKQASRCGRLVSRITSPWCSGFSFSTEISGLYENLWPDFSSENTIRNYRDELDTPPQHLANWSQTATGQGVLYALFNTQHSALASLGFQIQATYLTTLAQLPDNRATETLLARFREAPGF